MYAKIILGSEEGIECVGISKFLEDGTELIYVGSKVSGNGNSFANNVGGDETCHRITKWMKLGQNNRSVSKALNQIGTDFNSWDSFYKIYEILRDAEFDPVKNRENKRYQENKRLSETANHYRHSNYPLPKNPMSFPEAKCFTQALFLEWIGGLEG